MLMTFQYVDERLGAMFMRSGSVSLYILASSTAIVVSVPTNAQAQARRYDVPAMPLAQGIVVLARQAGTQILIDEEIARDRQGTAVVGTFPVEQAMSMLLIGTGLEWARTGTNSYSIVRSPITDASATPDILVRGQRQWSLNTGIKRTQDDSQPFQVFDGETIRKSGATDLETFLRNQLSVNASPSTAEQANGVSRNQSVVNLRGLGDRETLILVDGRRLAGTTNRDGSLGQPNLLGIPMAAIERIEVLASSASGIYGNGATGGVVNIVMRRDYRGGEASVTYSAPFAGDAPGVRADLTGGMALEGGRTNLTFSGSWSKADPLLMRDRADLIVAGRRQAIVNNPDFYRFNAPLGLTPNIRNPSGQRLVLKPVYGGGRLSSYYTSVPAGYRGVALDGVAPLVANAGSYSLDLSDNAVANGGRSALLYGTQQASASLAMRRDFNDWLKIYGELAYTRSTSIAQGAAIPSSILLLPNAPNNPFTTPVFVTVPFPNGAGATNRNLAETYRGVVGAIVKLPAEWQAVADVSRMRSTNSGTLSNPTITSAGLNSFRFGAQDILRDVRNVTDFTYAVDDLPWSVLFTPERNDILNLSLRLAGPLPVTLPGGRPTATISVERSDQDRAETLRAQNSFDYGSVDVVPFGEQRIDAVYGEINIPLIGGTHTLPLVRELLVTISARHERFVQSGSPEDNCFFDFDYLPTTDIRSLCPTTRPSATLRDSHTDPTFSARWRPAAGITVRGSYATGYLAPRISQLVRREAPQIYANALDPERGNTNFGTQDPFDPAYYYLPGFVGGNNELKPETSKTLTAGVIFQPPFVPGLRLSVDWTRIEKRNNYYDPSQLLVPEGDPAAQAAFEAFLRQYPDRVIRGPASDGFAVGPITSIDVSLANLVGSTSVSYDVVAGYTHAAFGGTIDVDARATYVERLSLQETPGSAEIQYAGVISDDFLGNTGGFGTLRWKGSGSIRWTNDRVGLGWQSRFFDSYFVDVARTFDTNLGAAKVRSQMYHDVSASYRFGGGFTLRGVVNNVFDKRPPLDTKYSSRLYSSFGDPRLANYQLTLIKAF